jgi:hypothetical protein
MSHWIQAATEKMEKKGTKGLFARQAERHGMSTSEWTAKEKNSPDPAQRKRANFAANVRK